MHVLTATIPIRYNCLVRRARRTRQWILQSKVEFELVFCEFQSSGRLVDLLEAEKKIKSESLQRAEVAEKKLAEKKAFYRIVRSWWKEFSSELGRLTNQPVNLTYHFPTEEEVQKEYEENDNDEALRVFGKRLRSF